MRATALKNAQQMKREKLCSRFIPFSTHIDPRTLKLRTGDYLRIWRLGGISHESADPEDIQIRADGINQLYRSIGTANVAIWTHNVRRTVSDRLVAQYENDFCRHLDQKYYDSLSGYRMMANELYLTVIYRPAVSRVEKAFHRAARRTIEDIKRDEADALKTFGEIADVVEQSLRRYDIDPLGTYSNDKGVVFSRVLEFLAFLINGTWEKIPVPQGPINEYLPTSRLFFGSESLEIRCSSGETRFAAALDFKDYPSGSEAGMLDTLMYENYEYVLTQSFSFLARHDAKSFLDRQAKQLQNAADVATSQIDQMYEALDQLISGEFAIGQYHGVMMVFACDLKELNRNVASARAALQDQGFLTARVDLALEAAYWSQLPGNWQFRPRIATLTSKNFAGTASFHNFSYGKRDNNPWGQAVMLLRTPSRQPYYFNFHSTKAEEDSEDKKVLGNTKIIGQSGSGKTVLLGMLLCQSQKYKPTTVFFDKDRGAEILIRVMRGKYLAMENGRPSGFNPFQMEPTEENILFFEDLVKKLVTERGRPLSTRDEQEIAHAVRTVARMPKELRRLSTVRQNVIDTDDESVAKRLAKWCQGGSLSWVLDNPVDELDFTSHSLYGFDGTEFLDNPEVRTPISMYLLHRMESIIDGRRFMYFMDEFWKWLLDPYFSDFAFNKQKTIRKQNGLGVFATQSAVDVLESPISRAIIEQCATDIYLPNPKADKKEYMEGFKLSETEFEIIRNLGEDSRMFLVKQGHSGAIASLDLRGFDDELVVLSGSLDNIALLDEIMAEGGDDPDVWLPLLQRQCRERVGRRLMMAG
ncbi:MAG: Type IV secretion system protein virB4 [Syntrophorhabdaceae bacterium PtaU1.Bin034]|nr:MAG: Type IV secretion system protein virB4 [Syntrophorhabdaceae bacterium PtaU1.Bin034]